MIIRPAKPADESALLALRNESLAQFWSGNRRPLGEAEHALWFEHALLSPEQHYIVMVEDGLLTVGYGRFHVVPEVRVSFAVQSDRRGQGIGTRILAELDGEARQRGHQQIMAYIHPGNYPSLRTFAKLGYTLDEMRTEKGVAWQIVKKSLT